MPRDVVTCNAILSVEMCLVVVRRSLHNDFVSAYQTVQFFK